MPLIDELPEATEGKTGWPWTEGCAPLPPVMPNGLPWPSISIITPSYNQGVFIEETIRSVLLQNYPNLEYIIIDGGSSDETLDIIKKYDKWIDSWVSEKDDGQSDAINKGMRQATGSIVNWLNSDDLLLERALFHVSLASFEQTGAIAWVGMCRFIDEFGRKIRTVESVVGDKKDYAAWGNPFDDNNSRGWIAQPSCYFNRSDYLEVEGVDNELYFTMDVDLWMKLSERGRFVNIDAPISCLRWYAETKTMEDLPGRMAEHVYINWRAGEKGESRNMILQFGREYTRELFLSSDTGTFLLMVATWLYRKLFKTPISGLRDALTSRCVKQKT